MIRSSYKKTKKKKGKEFYTRLQIEGIEVIVLNFTQSNKHSVPRRMIGFLQYLVTALYFSLRLRYDVAICSSGPISVGLMGILAKTIKRKKFVFEVRDLWPEGAIQLGILTNKTFINLARYFERKCYLKSDLVVAASPGMQQDITKRFPLVKVVVVPNASDVELFTNAVPPPLPATLQHKFIFIYAGSLGRMDDCMQLLQGAAAVNRNQYPQFHLLILGDGIDKEPMEAFVQKQHMQDYVTMPGIIPKTQVAGWMKHARAALLTMANVPVLDTTSPNKLFDAFAAGLPVIQTTQGWIKEMLAAENCGLTVPAGHAQAMATAFETYMQNPGLAEAHGLNALRLAQTTFNRNHCAANMLAAIEAL
ncbi:MAG TPA: glycosyltransferase family 4 protein [Phnomibacter sp.]|nr:glycosyltransferase family 4 protein [Phnomibacter sp.]